MNKNNYIRLFLLFTIIAYLLHSCSNDDDPIVSPNPEIQKIIKNINEDSIRNYVLMLENMETRFALAQNRKDVALTILRKFESYGYTNVKLDSFQLNLSFTGTYYYTWQYNVVATLMGKVYPDSIAIIGGHHDCIISSSTGNPFNTAPGANDNASGVATTLEIARILKKVNYNPDITIKFVTFAAEELGLYGSENFASKARETNAKIKMMLNNDMVAYWSKPDTSNWCVNVIDYHNSITQRLKAQEVCKTYTTLKTINNNRDSEYSDSYPFSLYGYKALFFISSDDDITYHTPNDLATACNFKFCREVAKLNCVLLIQDDFTN